MATLKVWLHQGTIIPSSVPNARCGNRSDSTIQHDAYYELSGSNSQLKSDYQAITGFTLGDIPTETSHSYGQQGNYFGGTSGDPAGE